MHNRNKARKLLKHCGDILLLALSFLAAVLLARRHAGMEAGGLQLGAREFLLLLVFILAWNSGARIFGLYDEFRSRSWDLELTALGQSIMLLAVSAVLLLFLVKSHAYSRFFVFIFCLLTLVSLFLWRAVLGLYIDWRHKNNLDLYHFLVVGDGALATDFAAGLAALLRLGYRLKGFIAAAPRPEMGDLYLGTVERLPGLLESDRIDEIILAYPDSAREEIERVIAICENFPVQVRIITENPRFVNPRGQVSFFGPYLMFSCRAIPLEHANWRLLKRGFDLTLTLLAFLLVFSWLWPLLALLIRISSPGPVFFRQERWGLGGRPFTCLKFRSMVRESRDVDENGRYQQAQRNDDRVTPLGRFLRRSNLDELPQFINVLKGEMSLVGPRPHPTPMNQEAMERIHRYQLRHLIKPGITGWAQVSGFRGDTSDPALLRRRVEADLWYIENWSFGLDLRILWLSVLAMFKWDANAY